MQQHDMGWYDWLISNELLMSLRYIKNITAAVMFALMKTNERNSFYKKSIMVMQYSNSQ
jgi:uncharacterized protein YehS (DUF1456 family)